MCLIWGSTWAIIRIGSEAGLPSFLAVASRFALAAIILWLWVALKRFPLPQTTKEWKASIANGILGSALSYAIVYWSAQYVDSALDAVIFGTMPVWTLLGGTWLLKGDRLTSLKVIGVFLGLAGILIIFLPGVGVISSNQLLAMGLMTVAPMVSALSTIITKKDAGKVNPVTFTAISITIGAVILGIIALFSTDFSQFTLNGTHVWTVGYLAVFGTIVSFVTYYELLRSTSAVTMAYVALITPVVAIILGWIIFSEQFTLYSWLGSGIVLLGTWMVLRNPVVTINKQEKLEVLEEVS